MVTFAAGDRTGAGYLALPASGNGPGVMVLHAWWGLNSFFRELCERLAGAGFVAFAPDLYQGQTAGTIDEAKALLEQRDLGAMEAIAAGALAYFRAHPAVRGDGIAALGFSMGAAWATMMASAAPADIQAVVLFYGAEPADFARSRAAYLGHFAEDDEWEPLDGVRQIEADLRAAGKEVTFHIYPGAHHWFFETNRPEYDADAAALAWQRSLDFLREHLQRGVTMSNTPTIKSELLERIHSSYTALERTIAQLRVEQMATPIDGSWSAKDLLAHIATWEHVMLEFHVGGKPFSEVTRLTNVPYGPTPVDQINEAFYERDKDLPLTEVLQAFRGAHQQLLETLNGMSEDDLFRPYTPPGRGPDSAGQLIDWVIGDSYEHYDEHRATLERLLEL
ncbi:MAG TPA: dienelactone hydrolase family protein [Roseiflexaceae bacterium]|nr:dienelactone hydrolase family protein [Roseiflexaceae bacterium]